MKKFVKLLCVAICVLLCASVLFSVGSAIYGHDHECVGEDCQYCQAFSLQQELMRLVLWGCFSASFAIVFVQMIITVSSLGGKADKERSLVACKVKLTA